MPKPQYRLFSPQDKPCAMDRLINEFGLFVNEFSLRTQIKNPEKVHKMLLCMRRKNVKGEVDRAIYNALTALNAANYLAIFYCLDDNLEAFKLCFEGADADQKRFLFYPLAIAAESPRIIEFLATIKPNTLAALLDELEVTIALFNSRAKISPKDTCQHLDRLLKNIFKQMSTEKYVEVILQIGYSAALYNNFYAWQFFIELLNKNELLVVPSVAEQLLISSAISGSFSMFHNAFLVYETTLKRTIGLNITPKISAKVPMILKEQLFNAAALSGSEELLNYLIAKLEVRTSADRRIAVFAWIDLGLPPAIISLEGIDPQLLIDHAVTCNLATLKKVIRMLPAFSYTFTQNTLELAFLSADIELINFVINERHGLLQVTDQVLKNALASGNPNVLLKAIVLLEERQGHFKFENLCETDKDGDNMTWPATPEMNACIKSLAEEYKFPIRPIN